MTGNFIEVVRKPQWQSVEEYRQYLLKNSPNNQLKQDIFDSDIECKCCTQKAPSEAAAHLKVSDETPYTTDLAGKPGKQVWICADCFFAGVRPKCLYYGELRWNSEGDRIKKRAKKHSGHPW